MLSLHTFARNFIFFLSPLMILTSCKDNSKADLTAVKILEEGLVNSNKLLNVSIVDLMVSLEAKLYDYSSKERAEIWFPKAKDVQKVSDETIKKIEKVKAKLETNLEKTFKEDDIIAIVDAISEYKNSILQIDSKLTKDYKRYLRIFARSIDSSEDHQIKRFREHFSGVSSFIAIAMLTKIENNIKLNEHGMITYCHEMSTPIFCGIKYLTQALVVQNSSIVQPKDEIEITAGLASFRTYDSSKIFIYDRSVKIGEDGAAHYKLKAASKPGKYYVPVKINYTDQNGVQQSIQKKIEYTVANIQQQ